VPEEKTSRPHGAVLQADKKGLKLACGGGTVLEILELRRTGRNGWPLRAFLMGQSDPNGAF
jgi:methionyl-tRNA formyltransferase